MAGPGTKQLDFDCVDLQDTLNAGYEGALFHCENLQDTLNAESVG